MSASAATLADRQEKALAEKRKTLSELDQSILEWAALEREALEVWLTDNPSKSPDAASQVGRLRVASTMTRTVTAH